MVNSVIQRVSELKGLLKSHVIDQIRNEEATVDLSNLILSSISTDIVSIEYELAFRNVLEDILAESNSFTENATSNSLVTALLKVAFEFGLKYHHLAVDFPKIPFFLIEDMLEGLTISYTEEVWKIIESMTELIIQPEMFMKGRFVILRTCNSLLRKLSKSCNSEYCGRVMTFLSTIYPLAERSAVNLSGKVNTSNTTLFEDESVFRRLRGEKEVSMEEAVDTDNTNNGTQHGGIDATSDAMEVVMEVEVDTTTLQQPQQDNKLEVVNASVPATAATTTTTTTTAAIATTTATAATTTTTTTTADIATNTTAAITTVTTTTTTPAVPSKGEEGEEQEEESILNQFPVSSLSSPPAIMSAPSPQSDQSIVSYSLYKAFWSLQTFTSSELKYLDSQSLWEEFFGHVQLILSAFESNSYSELELTQSWNRWMETKVRAVQVDTSSYSTANNNNNKDHPDQMNVEGNIDKGIADHEDDNNDNDNNDGGYMGCKYLTSPQLFSLQLRDPMFRQQITAQILMYTQSLRCYGSQPFVIPAEELSQIETRAYTILQGSPPNGQDVTAVMSTLLRREMNWISWKDKHCISFEKDPLTPPGVASTTATEEDISGSAVSKKRNRAGGSKAVSQKGELAAADLISRFYFSLGDKEVKETARKMLVQVPTFDNHIQPYEEAEDPDAGIEEAYHPKNNNVYCWRARRLLASRKVVVFEHMPDGDLSKGLKRVKGEIADSSLPVKDLIEENGIVVVGAGTATGTETQQSSGDVAPADTLPNSTTIVASEVIPSLDNPLSVVLPSVEIIIDVTLNNNNNGTSPQLTTGIEKIITTTSTNSDDISTDMLANNMTTIVVAAVEDSVISDSSPPPSDSAEIA